jgi:hypothetical protein
MACENSDNRKISLDNPIGGQGKIWTRFAANAEQCGRENCQRRGQNWRLGAGDEA